MLVGTIILDWCQEDYDDNEIFLGFNFDKEFELIPKTLPNDCLTQEHYPRSGEQISADDCEEACDDGTCLWEAIYVTNDDANDEDPIEDNGDGYCTEDEPCEQCVGDCDKDNECIGDLICCKRYRYDQVPTCSGGDENGSSKFALCLSLQMCILVECSSFE